MEINFLKMGCCLHIFMQDLFYRVTTETTGPLPMTKKTTKYILVAIDHYS